MATEPTSERGSTRNKDTGTKACAGATAQTAWGRKARSVIYTPFWARPTDPRRRRRRRTRSVPSRVRLRWLRLVWHVLGPWIRRAVLLLVFTVFLILLGHGLRTRYLLPDLQAWHTLRLQNEFRASDPERPRNLKQYLALEDRLFAELDRRLFQDSDSRDSSTVGRYNPDSIPGQILRMTPYNRTLELEPLTTGPLRGGALLLHGLTDSPYSMRATAQALREAGFAVLILRLPGHGTVPAALKTATAEDWKAAIQMGAAHMAERIGPQRPFWIGGYSTGATLALIHTLRIMDEPGAESGAAGRVPDRLLMLSPAIGVTEFAALSDILSSVAVIPAFQKASWYEILAEYDPHKYASFPFNAAKQVYRLTRELDRRLREGGPESRRTSTAGSQRTGQKKGLDLPPILSFQSLVDATVSPDAVAGQLFRRLRSHGHEMVVFDLNPQSPWLNSHPAPTAVNRLTRVLGAPPYDYALTLLTTGNDPDTIASVQASPERLIHATWSPGSTACTTGALNLEWPPGLISLSHVALPFPPDDPIYGLRPAPIPSVPTWPPWPLGSSSPRGERGTAPMDLAIFTRLRSNPFWDFVTDRIRDQVDQDSRRAASPLPPIK